MNIPHRKSFSETTVKVIGKNDSGDATIVRVLVTPFGHSKKLDLHGQYFTEDTYFGDNIVQVKFGLYEHFLNDLTNPLMAKMGKRSHILGPATLVKTDQDDEGRWFDIEVMRSLEYHDAVMDLIDMGVMGTSTQAFMNSVEVDLDDGRITMWIENEVSLTPTPADHKTIGKIVALKSMKSLPPLVMVKDGELVELDIDGNVSETTEEFEGETFTEKLDAIFTGDGHIGEDIKTVIQDTIREEVVKAFMEVRIDFWGEDFEEIRTMLTDLVKTMPEGQEQVVNALDDVQKAFLTFARKMQHVKVSEAGKLHAEMSQLERDLQFTIEHEADNHPQLLMSSGVPQGAPGRR